MKAVINPGKIGEITWTIDDQITPELVKNIEQAGDKLGINWSESQFMDALDLLLSKHEKNELEEMLYDEDPEVIEFITLVINNPLNEDVDKKLNKMVRLYLPVIIVLLNKKS